MQETFKIQHTQSSIFCFHAMLFIFQLWGASRNCENSIIWAKCTPQQVCWKNNLFSFLCLDAWGKKPIISAPLPPEIESRYSDKVLIPYARFSG